jgi:hypothetical protein
MNLCARDS